MAHLVDLAGRAVAVPVAALARARGGKPMHPRGVVFDALLERRGLATGIDWLDAIGADDVVVRLSRGAGLPPRWPDLLGFALRLPGERPVDLLLSSTGSGRWTRRVPVLRREAATGYGSIMAYRSAAGPVRLAAGPPGTGLPSAGGPRVTVPNRRHGPVPTATESATAVPGPCVANGLRSAGSPGVCGTAESHTGPTSLP